MNLTHSHKALCGTLWISAMRKWYVEIYCWNYSAINLTGAIQFTIITAKESNFVVKALFFVLVELVGL